MGGKWHERKTDPEPLLQVQGFLTVEQHGRFVVLECQGGNARDAVHALRDQIKEKNEVEVSGVIIRGLSHKYDLLYQLDREPMEDGRKATIVKFSCWTHLKPSPGPVPKQKQEPKQKVLYAPTDMPGIWKTGSKFRVRVGKHYVGVYPTFPEAVCAKTLYVARCGSRFGKRPVVTIGHSELLVNASVRS